MWLYKGRWLLRGSDTTALQGRSNGVIGCRRAANLYIFRPQGRRAQGGQATREAATALAVPGHDDVLCCYKYMPMPFDRIAGDRGRMHFMSSTRAKARSRGSPSKRQEQSSPRLHDLL